MKKVIALLPVMLLLTVGATHAAGLAIPEQGAASMGMAAAVTARGEDLSAIFYNPAGINYVQNFDIMLGITPISPTHEYKPFSEDSKTFEKASSKSHTYLPPQLYAAYRMNKDMVLGIGVFTPYGLGTDWDKTWNGRYTSTFAEIQAVHINPVISYKVNERTSLGFGLYYVTSTAKIEKMVDTGSLLDKSLAANTKYDSKFTLDGDGKGFGFNAGILSKVMDDFQVGASFRSAHSIKYSGKAKFAHQKAMIINTVKQKYLAAGASEAVATANAEGTYNAIVTNMPLSQDGDATLNMPWTFNLGMKKDWTPVWDMSFDVDVTGWQVYKALTVDFDTNKPKDKEVVEKDWRRTVTLRLGSSYDLSPALTARCGFMVDRTPVPSKTLDGQLPDAGRYGISLGAGYKIGVIKVDASYLFLKFSERDKYNGIGFSKDTTGDGYIDRYDVPAGYPIGNGEYRSLAHLFSVSASYQF